jgi:hypothetical protein
VPGVTRPSANDSELILSEPFAPDDKLTVHRGSGRASAAKGQVGVACENEDELAQ